MLLETWWQIKGPFLSSSILRPSQTVFLLTPLLHIVEISGPPHERHRYKPWLIVSNTVDKPGNTVSQHYCPPPPPHLSDEEHPGNTDNFHKKEEPCPTSICHA